MRRELEIRMSETKKDKSDVKSLWKITRIINKKYCNNKLKIDRIFMYSYAQGARGVACYLHNKSRRGTIGVYNKQPWRDMSNVLLHELSHAYAHQILKLKDGTIGRHNKRFWKTIDEFLDVLEKEGMTYKK
mgnify:CR=1 FL=1